MAKDKFVTWAETYLKTIESSVTKDLPSLLSNIDIQISNLAGRTHALIGSYSLVDFCTKNSNREQIEEVFALLSKNFEYLEKDVLQTKQKLFNDSTFLNKLLDASASSGSALKEQIVSDLNALKELYGKENVDAAKGILKVIFPEIKIKFENEEINFGRFAIKLSAVNLSVSAEPLEPKYVTHGSYSNVCHPHVLGTSICLGDATNVLKNLYIRGNVFEYFNVLNALFLTYNPKSPYAPIEYWASIGTCTDCEKVLTGADRPKNCSICGRLYCNDCISSCSCHGKPVCKFCGHACDCGTIYCTTENIHYCSLIEKNCCDSCCSSCDKHEEEEAKVEEEKKEE